MTAAVDKKAVDRTFPNIIGRACDIFFSIDINKRDLPDQRTRSTCLCVTGKREGYQQSNENVNA